MMPLDTPSPARVLAAAQLALQVVDDLHRRDPRSLSNSEADLHACLIGCREDLATIATTARAEMGSATVDLLRLGVAG